MTPSTSRSTLALIAGLAATLAVPAIASAQTQNLNLAWDSSASPNVSGYYVYAGTAPGSYNILSQLVVPAGQTAYAFQAAPGVKYFFAISAFDASGSESVKSPEVAGGIPTFTQPSNQASVVGTAIPGLSFAAADPDGGVLQYAATGLPPGLTLAATGRISGTPTTVGSYTVNATVTDGTSAVSRSFAWTVAPGAATVTVSPASPSTGSGYTQTFSLTYNDSLGAADLTTATALFNATLVKTGAQSCMVTYNPAANLLSLLNDAGSSWMSGTVRDATTLQNSQCAINLATSTVTRTGTKLVVKMPVTFKNSFYGSKNVYLYGVAAGGQNSGWQDRGNWTVPKPRVRR